MTTQQPARFTANLLHLFWHYQAADTCILNCSRLDHATASHSMSNNTAQISISTPSRLHQHTPGKQGHWLSHTATYASTSWIVSRFLTIQLHLRSVLSTETILIFVVLGWMISLSVEPGIEPGIFRFQSKVLAGSLLHHFPLCVSPPLSSFSSSLSFSLSLSLCFFFRSSSTFFSPRKTDKKKKKMSRFLFTSLYP